LWTLLAAPEAENAAEVTSKPHSIIMADVYSLDGTTSLSWSKEPEDPPFLGDYKIEIFIEGKNRCSKKVYNVHKLVVASGKTRSDLLQGKIRSGENFSSDGLENWCRFTLKSEEAEAFPTLLDHLYCLGGKTTKITNDNALSLYQLACFFLVSSLKCEVAQFWIQSMQLDDLATYFQRAETFHDENLRAAVVKKCALRIEKIPADSKLLGATDVNFWLEVAAQRRHQSLHDYPHLSTLLAEFCYQHQKALDSESFNKLTSSEVLSSVLTMDTAIKFLSRSFMSMERSTVSCMCTGLGASVMVEVLMSIQDRAAATRQIEELKEIQYNPPMSINVSGAGIAAVNGNYTRAEDFDEDEPRYTMNGTWDGQPIEFELALALFFLQPSCWSIEADLPNSFTEFYCCDAFEEEWFELCPPMRCWYSVEGGCDPPPTLQYTFAGNDG